MAEVILTKENFETEVLKSEIPVLVDFWATWCGPCMMLSPVIAELAEELAGKVKVGKVNVDEQNELAMQYRVASIPTLLLFKNGELVKTSVGFMPKAEIIANLGLDA
ncbi:MAG: thioredoxin [Agathobacter sp.]|nr:thioredoxin [Agathobacter sp.]